MKNTKHYDFYQEYIGPKCDYQKFVIRVRNGHSFERAIYPGRLNEVTRGYTVEDKQKELQEIRDQMKKIRRELYKWKEYRELKRRANVVKSTIYNIK